MKHLIVLYLYILLLISACTSKKPNIITFDLKRSDYLETINSAGTIQSVNNITIVTPRVNVSNLTVAQLAKEGTKVLKGDTICVLDAPELTNNFESLNIDLEKMVADLKKLEADNAMQLSLLKAQVETNEAQLAISMLDSIQLKFAPEVKKRLIALEMEKANVEKRKLQKKLAAQKRIDNSELIQMKSRIMQLENRIKTVSQQISSLKIISPVDGMVMHTASPKMMFMSSSGMGELGGSVEVGSSVWSNMSLLQIPDLKVMQVLVEVPESDYKRIKEGQKVMIRVESVANLNSTGKVKRKTLAGKKAAENAAVKTYEVIISVDSCHLSMKPGLSAMCRIIVDQVKDTIVVPATAIFDRDSSKVVYITKDELFIPVTIETGLSSSSKSIISKGLAGNETIALIEPPHYLIMKKEKNITSNMTDSSFVKKDSVSKISTMKN